MHALKFSTANTRRKQQYSNITGLVFAARYPAERSMKADSADNIAFGVEFCLHAAARQVMQLQTVH